MQRLSYSLLIKKGAVSLIGRIFLLRRPNEQLNLNMSVAILNRKDLSGKYILVLCCALYMHCAYTQNLSPTDSTRYKTVVAGRQYGTSSFHQWKWGKHYRKEWTTPVLVPLLILDTVSGGLTPYEAGGGRQSKNLRLRDAQGREYVLRSIDKTFSGALPEIYQNTFVEKIANDQVSIAHPYSAVTIPMMAEAAKIYHAKPVIRWLPQQKALDSFNKDFGNNLYLLEQRPDENWETAANFGNAKKIIGTDKLLEDILEDNDNRVDQSSFMRARLFDFFIGDWGRHDDQWRWATFEKEDDQKIYKAIPRDRDQAYTKFDGALLGFILSAADLDHLQSFGYKISDIERFNFPARNLDRRLLNELSSDQWQSVAKDLQQSLTDAVIETSVKQMPAELYPISGNEIIAKLKSRRDHLAEYALDYYKFLAKEVDITGSEKNEFFEIKRLDDAQTSVAIYKITKEGKIKKTPLYSRVFKTDETKEIRLYGITGNDKYTVDGSVKEGIKIRIIGGVEKDSITDRSSAPGNKTIVYDNPGNAIEKTSTTKLHLSGDTAINRFKYDAFEYDTKGIKASAFYNRADKIYVGLGYGFQKHKWRREPFAFEHGIAARYSIPQGAFNLLYKGRVNQFIGKWDLDLRANYDFIFWTNFFGIGNETEQITDNRNFYRTRSREGYAGAALIHEIGKNSSIELKGFYQLVKIMSDPERFVAKNFLGDKTLYDKKDFGGAAVSFLIQNVNDRIVPTKGIDVMGGVSYTQNLAENNRTVTRYEGMFNFYLPFSKNLVLSVRSGGATLSGKPEFYQLNSLGGADNLRGFRRDRFWAKSTFYNANELQWLFDFRSRIFNGKVGFFGLFDEGRVWQPGENSDTWHIAYGGGIMIAPFNKLLLAVSYAISKENPTLHLRFVRPVGK